eukprot:TRINITY_DN15063_c0_g1_i1.p1 TRINITY_DN15063_c0_g1~~TRINITY_DN15063_c0_g1_i1.p1  ORF type:complete len:180 (-),score=7.66 TRINITY_DN15063_c0_g1_i1:217-756(-)
MIRGHLRCSVRRLSANTPPSHSRVHVISEYPITCEMSVLWGDMDSFMHVNNVIYFRWFEQARMELFAKLADRAHMIDSSFDPKSFLSATSVGPILHSTSARYRIPLTHPDEVIAGAAVPADHVKTDRFLLKFAVHSRQHNKIACTGEGLIVTVNYQAGGKVAPLPEPIRVALKAFDFVK